LADLAYTVFNTETTGPEPRAGDEIIQIGATRIVAGKLHRQEVFEQRVDPQRSLPVAAVLPAFHAFAQDTALGDVVVTAEVFVKMLPLLQAQGIHTLGQAVAAAQQTPLARVKY
jgi:hypothetical protein